MTLGVDRRAGVALATTGTSFQFSVDLLWERGGAEGVGFLGGALN
jgi:hypothetical protein